MTAKHLCHANNTKRDRIPEYGANKVRHKISKNIQNKQITRQKSFILCESCFWCASLLYMNENEISISSSLKCPNCYNNTVELLSLF
jgi:hypothetical protein